MQLPAFLKRYDFYLLGLVVLIVVWGIVMIYSTGTSGETGSNGTRQVVFALVGLAAYLVLSFLDYRWWQKSAWYIVGLVMVGLLGLFIAGAKVRGALSWYDIGPVNIQPAEFAKMALVLGMAALFARSILRKKTIKHIVIASLLMLLFVVPTALQPDMGTASVLMGMWVVILLFSGIKLRHVLILVTATVVIGVCAWFFFLADYQKNRVLGFVNPDGAAVDTYNTDQALIAIGSGGVFGKGLGYGSQSTLNFLPEKHTDFVFAVLAEELGLIGVCVFLGLFSLLFWRIISIMRATRDPFAVYLCLGTFAYLIVQWTMNVAINLGLMPVTGVSLPLVSYGGSGLIATMMLLGLCASVSRYRYKREENKSIDPFSDM